MLNSQKFFLKDLSQAFFLANRALSYLFLTCWMQSAVNFVVKVYVTLSILFQNLITGLARKRRSSQDYQMKNDSNTKHITYWFVMSLSLFEIRNFWSNITWSTATNINILINISKSCQSKISNHTVKTVLLSKENIFWF